MAHDRLIRLPHPSIPGISDSVRDAQQGLLYVSGSVALPEDGRAPRNFSHAVDLTFGDMNRQLEAAGATFSDLIRINVWITDLDADRLRVFREVRDRWLDVNNLPASSVIGVAKLYDPRAWIEIDSIAAV